MYEKIANVTELSHEEWLRLRKAGIGGSDAGAVCGVNPFVSAISVFQDKTSEDKSLMLQYTDTIFHDKDYTDKEYYRDYKTIFHLRKALIDDQVEDNGRYARLAYPAILNMF